MINDNGKTYIQWMLGTIGALSLIVMIFFISVVTPVFNKSFFFHEYKKNSTMATIGIDEQNIATVTTCIMEYLSDTRDDLNVSVVVKGQTRAFFNEREQQHMADVKALFMVGYAVKNIAMLAFIVSVALLVWMKCGMRKILSKCLLISSGALLTLFIGTAILISTNFDLYFTKFHTMFFNNDLWILNPDTDLLINLVPQQFFIDMSVVIASIFVILMLLVFFVSVSVRKGTR